MCVNCFGGADFAATNAVIAAGGVSAWVSRWRRGRSSLRVSDEEVERFLARLDPPRVEAPSEDSVRP